MQTPTVRELLACWERGLEASPTERALLLLSLAVPQASHEARLRASLGHRDRWLIDLRERLFGERFACLTRCAACGERIDIEFIGRDIRASHAAPGQQIHVPGSGDFRLPCSADLLALEALASAGCPPGQPARTMQVLLQRCRVAAPLQESIEFSCADTCAVAQADESSREAAQVTGVLASQAPELLTEEQLAHVSSAFEAADTQAEVLLDMACPACGAAAQQLFDISSFLWTELDHWARGMLRKVHLIASRYGWSEDQILGLSTPRRQAYLQMMGVA